VRWANASISYQDFGQLKWSLCFKNVEIFIQSKYFKSHSRAYKLVINSCTIVHTICVRRGLNSVAWTRLHVNVNYFRLRLNTLGNCNKVQTNGVSDFPRRRLLDTTRTSIANSGAIRARYFYIAPRSRSWNIARITGSLTCKIVNAIRTRRKWQMTYKMPQVIASSHPKLLAFLKPFLSKKKKKETGKKKSSHARRSSATFYT